MNAEGHDGGRPRSTPRRSKPDRCRAGGPCALHQRWGFTGGACNTPRTRNPVARTQPDRFAVQRGPATLGEARPPAKRHRRAQPPNTEQQRHPAGAGKAVRLGQPPAKTPRPGWSRERAQRRPKPSGTGEGREVPAVLQARYEGRSQEAAAPQGKRPVWRSPTREHPARPSLGGASAPARATSFGHDARARHPGEPRRPPRTVASTKRQDR